MNCEECRALMMDALYSEELAPQACYGFFQHLNGCAECHAEYLELLRTREALASWEIEEYRPTESPAAAGGRLFRFPRFRRRGWWVLAREVAAGILILVGAASVLQGVGLWNGGDRMTVSRQGLVEMMNDIYVANSDVERRLFGQALVNFSDQIDDQRSRDRDEMAERIYFLEKQLLEVREENGRYLRALLESRGE